MESLFVITAGCACGSVKRLGGAAFRNCFAQFGDQIKMLFAVYTVTIIYDDNILFDSQSLTECIRVKCSVEALSFTKALMVSAAFCALLAVLISILISFVVQLIF